MHGILHGKSLLELPPSHHPQPPKGWTKVSTVNRTKDPWWGLTSETAIGTQTQQMMSWLVVSTHLKNISQNGNLPQIGVKIKNVWNHHLVKFDSSTIRKHWGPNIVCILRTTKLPYLLSSHWIEIFLARMLLTKSEMVSVSTSLKNKSKQHLVADIVHCWLWNIYVNIPSVPFLLQYFGASSLSEKHSKMHTNNLLPKRLLRSS